MASTEQKPAPSYDGAAVSSGLPPFVKIPTGVYELNEDGSPALDKDGNPKQESQAYLVRRTGGALKEINKIETDLQAQAEAELREEQAWWRREEKEEEDDSIPEDKKYKVDLELVAQRRKERGNAGVDAAYRCLAELLVHPATKEHPDVEEMVENLDVMLVREWMQAFVPDTPINAAGEPEETPTASGSGTDPSATG